MRNLFIIIFIFFVAAAIWYGCTTPKFIPEGSQSLGVYEGRMQGKRLIGDLRVQLHQTPEGQTLFMGSFSNGIGMRTGTLFMRGELSGNTLSGTFQGEATGSIEGQVSTDSSQLNGTYTLTRPELDRGTWKTVLK